MRVRARKVEREGIVFDSVHESEVYMDLRCLERLGAISELKTHVPYEFVVNGVRICKMKPDFSYIDAKCARHIVDAKGFKKSKKTGKMLPRVDREFHIKRNLMRALYGLEIEIL